ncbi:MAG: hypothetical protein EXR50_04625 [Dehalococcoidia bacterium]|nr:hypothetical protein [Dehalococcoidia bacterium]
MELDDLEPAMIRTVCQDFGRKCLLEGDMVLYSLSQVVFEHPERLKELADRSPRFMAELTAQKKRMDETREQIRKRFEFPKRD